MSIVLSNKWAAETLKACNLPVNQAMIAACKAGGLKAIGISDQYLHGVEFYTEDGS